MAPQNAPPAVPTTAPCPHSMPVRGQVGESALRPAKYPIEAPAPNPINTPFQTESGRRRSMRWTDFVSKSSMRCAASRSEESVTLAMRPRIVTFDVSVTETVSPGRTSVASSWNEWAGEGLAWSSVDCALAVPPRVSIHASAVNAARFLIGTGFSLYIRRLGRRIVGSPERVLKKAENWAFGRATAKRHALSQGQGDSAWGTASGTA